MFRAEPQFDNFHVKNHTEVVKFQEPQTYFTNSKRLDQSKLVVQVVSF